jgi:hypothetical protein
MMNPDEEMDKELKQSLWKAMNGPGGVPHLLMVLRNIACEQAEDCRTVRNDEGRADQWDDLARALDRALIKARPLLVIE